jgi:hypothetical protein
LRFSLISLTLLLVCSCTSGLTFKHDKIPALDLHSVKQSDYTDLFGDPFRTVDVTTSDGRYQQVWFYKAFQPFLGNASRRDLLLEFKNDQLNGYFFVSSFDVDKTKVDLTKVAQIKIGTSTKSDVLSLFGKPGGKTLCPSQLPVFKDKCTKPTEIWAWFEVNKTGSIASRDTRGRKSLFVMFDANDKVIDLHATNNE